jgi:hypothetical protein
MSADAEGRGRRQETSITRERPTDYTYQRFSLGSKDEQALMRSRDSLPSSGSVDSDLHRFSSKNYEDDLENNPEEEDIEGPSASANSMLGDKLYGLFPVLNALRAKR